jgi:hypothetical protein
LAVVYRCFNLDPGNHIIGVDFIEAEGDLDACHRAHDLKVSRNWHAMELWQLKRKVSCPKVNP